VGEIVADPLLAPFTFLLASKSFKNLGVVRRSLIHDVSLRLDHEDEKSAGTGEDKGKTGRDMGKRGR